MTYKEAYDLVLPEPKRSEEKYNVFVTWFIRPISILITLPIIKTSIKPTTITKVSILFSLAGFFLMSFGRAMPTSIIGWTAFMIWVLLDAVDGNLARCKNECSALGDLWDTMGGYIAMVLIFFGAGIAAFYDNNTLAFCEDYWLIIIGSSTAIFSIFPRLILHKKKSSVGNTAAVKQLSDKSSFGLKNIIAMNIVSPTSFMDIFLLIAIVLHSLNWFVIIYFAIYLAVMMISLYSLLKE